MKPATKIDGCPLEVKVVKDCNYGPLNYVILVAITSLFECTSALVFSILNQLIVINKRQDEVVKWKQKREGKVNPGHGGKQ